MPNLTSASRFLKEGYTRRLLPAGRLLKERLLVRPLRFAGPYLKKGLVVRPLLFSFIVIGAVLMFMGVREYRRSSGASAASAGSGARSSSSAAAGSARPSPREVTIKDFAGKGPGDKAYVRLTDFEFTDHYTHRKGDRGWDVVCVPAVEPREVNNPGVRVPKVLVKSNQTRNARDLYELGRKPIEGVVVKGVGSLSTADQALLRKHYSYLDLDRCWVLEAGVAPAATASANPTDAGSDGASTGASVTAGGGRSGFGKIGGGAGLAILAVGALLLAGRRA
jgi:hypothetical protein